MELKDNDVYPNITSHIREDGALSNKNIAFETLEFERRREIVGTEWKIALYLMKIDNLSNLFMDSTYPEELRDWNNFVKKLSYSKT